MPRRLAQVVLETRIDLGSVELVAEAGDGQELARREAAQVDAGRGVDEDPEGTRAVVDDP